MADMADMADMGFLSMQKAMECLMLHLVGVNRLMCM